MNTAMRLARSATKRLAYASFQHLFGLLNQHLVDEYGVVSYAQEGEDLILQRLLAGVETGFYVDVGAHHPKRFSNTYMFYRKGWRGINIDAMPGSMRAFSKERPRDINVEVAIADARRETPFFMLSDPALNSFDPELTHRRSSSGLYRVIGQKNLVTRTLADVLDEYLPPARAIDFLSVDVEGMDLVVLRSNNWEHYRPHYVVAECLALKGLVDLEQDETYSFLCQQQYEPVAKTSNTLIFRSLAL